MPLVWEMPDGSVQITTLTDDYLETHRGPGEETATAVMRLAFVIQAKTPGLTGGVPALVKRADVPPDRSKRHAWRLKTGRVIVDPTVPDKPHPKQALLDEIEAANSIGQLKVAFRKALGG